MWLLVRLRRLLLVFVLGGALSLFNVVFGLGVSAGVPLTQSNVTVAGSIGAKDKAVDAHGSPAFDLHVVLR
jgi:hypothetical protein